MTRPPEVGQLITGVSWGISKPMRTSRFSEEQVLQILQEARAGTAVKVRMLDLPTSERQKVTHPDHGWNCYFVHDQTKAGASFRH